MKQKRESENEIEKEKRKTFDRTNHRITRQEESFEKKLRDLRKNVSDHESKEPESEHERLKRLTDQSIRSANNRALESEDERKKRHEKIFSYKKEKLSKQWKILNMKAFEYCSEKNYKVYELIKIGKLDNLCQFCRALRFDGEPNGICCQNGKIKLPELEPLPAPLSELIIGESVKSREFLNHANFQNTRSSPSQEWFPVANDKKNILDDNFKLTDEIIELMSTTNQKQDEKNEIDLRDYHTASRAG